MRQIFTMGLAGAILCLGGQASAQFVDCLSAQSSGYNTTAFFVSAVFNTIGCRASAAQVTTAQESLANVISTQQLTTSMPDELKVCYYQGLYEGYIETLLSEYRQCRAVPSAATLGAAAGAIFVALYSTIPDFVDDGVVEDVFESIARQRTLDGQIACSESLLSSVEADFAEDEVAIALAEHATAVVCGN